MDEQTKKKLIVIRDLIKQQKYQQALDEAEILIYKNTKSYQIYLMAGLCYDKLGKYKEAEEAYKQVLNKKPDQVNAVKALGEMYTRLGNVQKSVLYMEEMLKILKNTDPIKYRQNLVKLVQMHEKKQDMQKIDVIYKQLLESESQLSQQFLLIVQSWLKTGITNKCFFLDHFLPLGVKGQSFRVLQPSAKQKLNSIIIRIVEYLYSIRLQYKMSNKQIADSIYQLKQYFPFASCFLMLFLLDEYCVSQSSYNGILLQEIYMLLLAYFEKVDNCYLNIQILQPQIFITSLILSFQYLAFMKQFFILDQCFTPYYEKLSNEASTLQSRKIREQYQQKISKFILKQCRIISKISETRNVQDRLQSLKVRIMRLDQSYLEEVIAKMAMNCFVNYQKLSEMRNLLKTRINNFRGITPIALKDDAKEKQGVQNKGEGQGEQQLLVQPHLYKYYYDYLIKIAKLYKSLDEQISIYDVIQYINKHDKKDLKYIIEYYWIEVGKNSKLSSQSEQQDLKKLHLATKSSLKEIEELLPKLSGSLQSQSLRKCTVLNIILNKYNQILDGLKLALGTERSFENLQSMGFYYFLQGDYQRALRFMKEAFVIRQDQFHLNRAIFVGLIKIQDFKEAYAFLQRIYEGFPNVYWVNYALAIHSINTRKLELAYKYMSTALQSFQTGISKTFKYSYEKTIQLPNNKYSLLYMIDQNKFQILFDYFVIPERIIYEIFPMASSLFFDSQRQIKQIKIQTQLGEILKLLGRNKSSYNHLFSAHQLVKSLPQAVKKSHTLQLIVTKKQFATMLFYVHAYKQSEQLLKQALQLCQAYPQPHSLLATYRSQIHSLLFEVSVSHLDQMTKFQSYQSVEDYIVKFNEDLKLLSVNIEKPSLNYYKAKYQFQILWYLHERSIGIQKSVSTIRQFLGTFDLDWKTIGSDKFYSRLIELKNQERIIVKQCLQDYYILLYMNQNSTSPTLHETITAQDVLPLVQLFPTSPTLYILYGMLTPLTHLKIASFLKCIQLDRQSPISVDLLASLYLKEKDYLTACKLFLKSLEIDLFNPKSYVGLCTCLYVLVGSCLKGDISNREVIKKASNKINSYMEFLRIVDPSENYHMLKFLRNLISDQPIEFFELKAGLQQSRKLTSHKYSKKLLYRLLQDSTQYLKNHNIWKQQGQQQIFWKYLQNNNLSTPTQNNANLAQIGSKLLQSIIKQLTAYNLIEVPSYQIRIKIKCKLLNKLCICANIFSRSRDFNQSNIDLFLHICQQLEKEEQNSSDQELEKMKKQVKQAFLAAFIKSHNENIEDTKDIINQIKEISKYKLFKQTATFQHIQIYLDHFNKQINLKQLKKYIFYNIHNHPCDPILRKTLLSWLLIVQKKNNLQPKKIKSVIDYRLQTILLMNSDEQANATQRFHKKNLIINNIQEPNAWVGYIAELWKIKKDTKWIGQLKKILKMYEGKQNILATSSRDKAKWTLFQMLAEAKRNGEIVDINDLPKQLKQQLEYMSGLQLSTPTNIPLIKSQKSLKYLMCLLVEKYQCTAKLEHIIDKCISCPSSANPETKGYFYLLKFISVCGTQAKNQEEMAQQLRKLYVILGDCQAITQQVHVHPNAIAIMKCLVSYLSLNYQQLQIQLSNAYCNRFAAYSDQILINYFQIMRLYRQVQVNHQGENVYENFTQYINAMIDLVKEPFLKSLFYGLKAMAAAIVAEENRSVLIRELKYALALGPGVGAPLLNKK